MARTVYAAASLLAKSALSVFEWLRFLELIYPEVERSRRESATAARRFYDSERTKYLPELPRNEVPLEGTTFEAFVQSMDAARHKLSQEDTPNNAVASVALQAVRSVEMAGRKQIIHAVEEDEDLAELIESLTPDEPSLDSIEWVRDVIEPDDEILDTPEKSNVIPFRPRVVQGWARVATGAETCAWCLMLISRGPVYHEANTAGLDLDDESATEAFGEAGLDYGQFFSDTEEYMEEWHTGCDCKVVPVFKLDDWPGLAAQKRAEELWIDASKEARRLIDSGESRTDNLNKETQNALRRRLYRGDVHMTEFAATAA